LLAYCIYFFAFGDAGGVIVRIGFGLNIKGASFFA